MSYSISTLLTRNLHDVFGENDPARRRAAIDEMFNEDAVYYDRSGAYPPVHLSSAQAEGSQRKPSSSSNSVSAQGTKFAMI